MNIDELTPEELKAQIESQEYVVKTLKANIGEFQLAKFVTQSILSPNQLYSYMAMKAELQTAELLLNTLKSKQ